MIFIKPSILRDQSEAADATGKDYSYMLHQQNSVIPEQFPQLLRDEPAPRLPPLPPPPPPGTDAAPSPLEPHSQPKKPETNGTPPQTQTAPAPSPQAAPSPPPKGGTSGATPSGDPP